jgi:hypothetical protein
MSEKTARTLKEATAALEARQAEADVQKKECLAVVARGIPGRVEEIARRAAHSQPEVTKELGSDGVKELRKQLAGRAAVIASEIESAADQIEWPRPQYVSSPVEPRSIHSALFKFLYGRRVDSLAAILKEHGFTVHDDNAQRSQGLVLPQSLYDEGEFAAVAKALSALALAERAVEAARKEDDRDIVDSLWDEG